MSACGPDIDDPDLPLQALFDRWPATVSVFSARGMWCFGCAIAPFHSVVDACLEYGLNEPRFREDLRRSMVVPPL